MGVERKGIGILGIERYEIRTVQISPPPEAIRMEKAEVSPSKKKYPSHYKKFFSHSVQPYINNEPFLLYSLSDI